MSERMTEMIRRLEESGRPRAVERHGDVLIVHGDALELMEMVLPCVDAVLTDPPYGIGLEHHAKRNPGQHHDWRVTGDNDQSTGQAIINQARASGVDVIAFASPWAPWQGHWRSLIVWDKGGAVGGGGDTRTCLKRTWELIHVHNHRPIALRDESVWRHFVVPSDASLHVCQKPVKLMDRLVTTFTREGDVIVDPFAGSGTTGIAAMRRGRKCVLIECDDRHFRTIRARVKSELRAVRESLFGEVMQ